MSKVLAIVLFMVAFAASGQAQTATAKESAGTAAEQYQSSLNDLAASYEEGLKRLTDQNAKIKELFDKGLVARRDLEQSARSVEEAQAKLDSLHQEIATAKAAALKPATSMIAMQNSDAAWTTGNALIDALIRDNGERYGIDPYLIFCVMHQESGFRPTAVSGKGALGLMQLMPATAARYGVLNPYDPAQSIKAGARYLRELLDMFDGKVELTLAAYNAGEGAVMKYGNRVPPYQETQAYVRNITARYTGSGRRAATSKTTL